MGKGNMMAETTSHLTARLYAALKHTPGCSCGDCSGGLNAVDEMERRILAAEARVTELEAAINRALTSIGMEFYGGRRGQTAEILRAALAAPTKEDTDE